MNTYLQSAVNSGDLKLVKKLMDQGSSDIISSAGPALHLAFTKNHINIIKYLLEKNVDVNYPCKYLHHQDFTPLHIATVNNNLELVNLLLVHKADVNALTRKNKSALHLAIQKNYLAIIESLIKDGANIEQRLGSATNFYQRGYTPLHMAIVKCNLKLLKLLITNGASVNSRTLTGESCLHLALFRSTHKIVEYLLDHGSNINEKINSSLYLAQKNYHPLHIAVLSLDVKKFKLLLSRGVDIHHLTPSNEGVMCIAVLTQNIPMIESILENGININYPCLYNNLFCTALQIASSIGADKEVINYLLSKGADPNPPMCRSTSALTLAMLNGNLSTIKSLLNSDYVDVNSKYNYDNKTGYTALHIAACCSYAEDKEEIKRIQVVNYLMTCGADVNLLTDAGESVISLALINHKLRTVEFLLNHGVDVNSKSTYEQNKGFTLLHIASCSSDFVYTSLRLLVDNHADLNAVADNGDSVLHTAVNKFNSTAVEFLLDAGADFNAIDRFGKTLLDNANGGYLIKIIQKHIIKMHMINSFVNEGNLNYIKNSNAMDSYKESCLEEIDKMKSTKIKGSNVTYYDIIEKNIHTLSIYMRNKNIVDALSEYSDVYRKFPIYYKTLWKNFKLGFERKKLMVKIERYLDNLTEASNIFSRYISIYLDNDDIINLITVLKVADIRGFFKFYKHE
ncbi:putative ankyrin repeat protein RF_0381 [Microplitis demolitor]|uniref:putative ankyrin repeat protein RF_0381 n=1 Tax=Microplitis demolitor TaxID=69319 RepID=UPI0004CD1DCD|nr:putative ankyrin repeat protein RF_0381 [Microplitis demolitor]